MCGCGAIDRGGQAFVAVSTDVHRVTIMRDGYHRNVYRKDAHRSYFAVLTLKTPGDPGQPGERLSSGRRQKEFYIPLLDRTSYLPHYNVLT